MSWDDLEPGQDDLVQEDKAGRRFKKAVKNARPGHHNNDAIYTDHNAGDPRSLTPNAERGFKARRANAGGPVRGSIFERIRIGITHLRQNWQDAVVAARQRQSERKKGKK